MNYITPIKTALDIEMRSHCDAYLIYKRLYTSPRFYNFGDFDYDTRILTIQSTQNRDLFFKIDCKHLDVGFFDGSEFWQQFKEYRTNFLLDNYLEIDRY